MTDDEFDTEKLHDYPYYWFEGCLDNKNPNQIMTIINLFPVLSAMLFGFAGAFLCALSFSNHTSQTSHLVIGSYLTSVTQFECVLVLVVTSMILLLATLIFAIQTSMKLTPSGLTDLENRAGACLKFNINKVMRFANCCVFSMKLSFYTLTLAPVFLLNEYYFIAIFFLYILLHVISYKIITK